MPSVLTIIRDYTREDMRPRVQSDTDLSELGMNELDRWFSLPTRLEEEFNLPQFTDGQIASWICVADVERAVEGAPK